MVNTKTKGNIKQSITELIGRTPLLALTNYQQAHEAEAEIVVKLEYLNPAGSVKDRTALAMIEDAEAKGILTPGQTLIETTSGNTGIGLAAIAATKGYKLKIYMQDGVSAERSKVVRAYGAEVHSFSDVPAMVEAYKQTDLDFVETVHAFNETIVQHEKDVVFLNQLDNSANPKMHLSSTGPEIWEDTDGEVDIFVACIGTGGTVNGTGTYLKSKNPNVQIIGVEPDRKFVATFDEPNVKEITGTHRFSDGPEHRVPGNVNRDVIDELIAVETPDAYNAARQVAKTDGILVGISSGAALHAATVVAKRPENKGKRVVALLADTGLRYLSTDLFD